MSKKVDRDLTSMRIHNKTKKRLIQMRARMEVDGKRRTIEDVINALLDRLEGSL